MNGLASTDLDSKSNHVIVLLKWVFFFYFGPPRTQSVHGMVRPQCGPLFIGPRTELGHIPFCFVVLQHYITALYYRALTQKHDFQMLS
jgi:hypothetical protein